MLEQRRRLYSEKHPLAAVPGTIDNMIVRRIEAQIAEAKHRGGTAG